MLKKKRKKGRKASGHGRHGAQLYQLSAGAAAVLCCACAPGEGGRSSLPGHCALLLLLAALFRLEMKIFLMSHRICRKDVGRDF